VNDTDANLKNRANHTGTQVSSTISDLTETVQDVVGAMVVAGSNVTKTYNDVAGTLTIAASGVGGGGSGIEVVTPGDYGAVGNGSTNDTTALNTALSDLSENRRLFLPEGITYAHSGVLNVTVNGSYIFGSGTLKSTTQTTSALKVVGVDDVTIEGINLTSNATTRGSTADHHKIHIEGGHRIRVKDVNIDGSHAAGVLMWNADDITIDRVYVKNTKADGFHVAAGTTNVRVTGCISENVGDDGFAVVSYDVAPPIDVQFSDCLVNGQTNGRGITCVGGQRIQFSNIQVINSFGAGILVAVESNYFGSSDVSFNNITLINSNQGAPGLGHAAIYVTNSRTSGFLIDRVFINGVTLINTNTSALAQCRFSSDLNADNVRNIDVKNVTVLGTGPTLFNTNNVSNTRYQVDPYLTGDGPRSVRTVAGAVSDAAFTDAVATGQLGLDTTNSRLYVRVGSTWKYATLT
jgi:hypothetical protein